MKKNEQLKVERDAAKAKQEVMQTIHRNYSWKLSPKILHQK
jgi:hypothetical protein